MTGLFVPPLPAIVGHRGARSAAPENTLAAFHAAVEQGASWVELDVRLSADRVPMVRHDADLADGRLVAELDSAALRAAGVADLAAVLGGLAPYIGVDVEIKNLPGQPDYDPDQTVVHRVASVVAETAARPLLVTSFNPETLQRAAAVLPGVATGWLYSGNMPATAAAEIAEEYGATVLCPHVDVGIDPAEVAVLHPRGFSVMVWTVNDGVQIAALGEAGVDAVCTDEPKAALAALGR